MNAPDLVAQTIFCEQARLEAQGLVSLMGILPDNIALPPPPSAAGLPEGQVPSIPALCLYTRIRFPLDRPIRGDASFQFLSPSGQIIYDGQIEKGFLESNMNEARGHGNEYMLVIQQANVLNFPILETGRFVAVVNYEGEVHFSGALKIALL